MIVFLKYCNVDLLEIIETSIPSLLDVNGKLLPRNTWFKEQKYKYQLNVKTRHILICVLSKEDIAKVHVARMQRRCDRL